MIECSEVGDGVWHLELQRPEKRNALSVGAYSAMASALRTISEAEDARVVVISGQGHSFCAGNDLTEFSTQWPQPPEGPVVRFLVQLSETPIPIIAAIQGGVVGIGATMLLHCDFIIANTDAFLQYPFVDLGISPEGGSSHLLPMQLGLQKTIEIFLSGRRIFAAEALQLGLISQISDKGEHLDRAFATARSIAKKSARAVKETKRLCRTHRGNLKLVFETEIKSINELIGSVAP